MIVQGVHIFLVHLNAHSAFDRIHETQVLADMVAAATPNPSVPVIVMGDMNMLSPRDDKMYEHMVLQGNPWAEEALSSMDCYNRLRQKFMTYDRSHGGQLKWRLSYSAMNNLLRAGLIDLWELSSNGTDEHTLRSSCRLLVSTSAPRLHSLEHAFRESDCAKRQRDE